MTFRDIVNTFTMSPEEKDSKAFRNTVVVQHGNVFFKSLPRAAFLAVLGIGAIWPINKAEVGRRLFWLDNRDSG
jgi:hypothetical protein